MNDLSESIAASEPLCRYIFSDRHYSSQKRVIKHGAFLPKDGKTSVFRVTGLKETMIWEIGLVQVARVRGETLHGRADLFAADVERNGLQIQSDTASHKRHANLVGWPTDKEEQRVIAIELARAARLSLIH